MAQDVALLTQWRERLKRQEESGLTIEAFCEKEGVSTSMFYRWRRHLQDSSTEPAAGEPVDAVQRAGKKRGGPPRRKRAKAGEKRRFDGRAGNGPSVSVFAIACAKRAVNAMDRVDVGRRHGGSSSAGKP